MLFLFFITSGLFLGWSLGANDAANIFGTAVGSRMIKFKKAAIIAGIFVIIGATFQGSGAAKTLSQLGSIDALGGAFTVALCSALVVTWMTYKKLPVSTSQAIVGAIVGWCYYTSHAVDYSTLSIIVISWVVSPLLGALFSALFYFLLRGYIRKSKVHVIKLDGHIKYALLIVGAFGAYSLGANNIANVMGVFVDSANFTINIGSFAIGSAQALFFLGGIFIAIGILTFSKKVMSTLGEGILEMTPETAIVVVLSQALVLFIFSSTALSNLFVSMGLPAIPLVPVSSTQVVVGAVIGIGAVKGMQEIRFKQVGNIIIGWIVTPILAGIVTFFSLFFVNNVFQVQITNTTKPAGQHSVIHQVPATINMPAHTGLILLLILAAAVFIAGISIYLQYNRSKQLNATSADKWSEQLQYAELQKSLSEIEIKDARIENGTLRNRLDEKRKELVTYALSIAEQRQFLENTLQTLQKTLHETSPEKKNLHLLEVTKSIKQKMSFSDEIEQIYQQAELVNDECPNRLSTISPNLSPQEKRLALLLRVGFSSKEIAPLLNISPKSVEIARYRLRKKFDLKKEENLTHFIKTI